MKRLRRRIVLSFLILALFLAAFIPFVGAVINQGDNALVLEKDTYAPAEIISGHINLSLVDESADSKIKTNLNEQNLSLLDFLISSGLKADEDFYCKPSSCEGKYELSGSGSSSRELEPGTNVIGSIITGKEIELQADSMEFSITGEGSGEYCIESPAEFDLLADGSTDWVYSEVSDEFCGALLPSSQCYDDDFAVESFDITQDSYCEKISLPVSGRFKLAALVKKNKGGGDLFMFIYDKGSGEIMECDLEEPNTTTSFIEKSCIVNFSVSGYIDNKDYYVCIRDDISNNAYSVRAELKQPLCGYAGLPDWVDNASADFALLVQPTAIAVFDQTIMFNEEEFSKTHAETLNEYLRDYIREKYNNDCSAGCVIPILFKNKDAVRISDFSLSYCAQGLCKTEKRLFDVEEKSALVSMNFTRLSLEKTNFSAPDAYGKYTFSVSIGSQLLGSREISVAMIPIITNLVAISPGAAAPTQLIVEAYSPKNTSLARYEWNFGDGTIQTTYTNEVIHTYEEIGIFEITIKVTDAENLTGSRKFTLQVGSPKNILQTTIEKKRALLQGISGDIEKLSWYKSLVNQKLNLYELQDKIDEYEKKFQLASTDEEYVDLMNEVEDLVVPKKIYDAEIIQESPLIVGVDDIRPEYFEELGAGAYQAEYDEETRNAIWDWQWKNVDVRASGKVIGVAKDDDSVEAIATVINLKLKSKKTEPLEEVYFVLLEDYNQMSFESDYGQKSVIGAAGFVFEDMDEKKISLALAGKADINELVFFASPSLYDIDIVPEEIICNNNDKCEPSNGENWKNCRKDCKPIGLALFYFILVIFLMAAAYLFLQKWYKKSYERHLFKNPQDIYNLTAFSINCLRKGLSEQEILGKLKEAGWGREQIDYVLKKVKGKHIGLPEIKLGKIKGIGKKKH